MKKKLLYSIFFVSIFLLSTATMVQPVRGYDWGIPKEAIGVTGEGEVKLYDEDEFEDHLGAGVGIDDIISGDSDVVGAKSKSKYLEMEEDEDIFRYTKTYVLEPNFQDGYNDIKDLLPTLGLNASTLLFLSGGAVAYGPYGPLAFIANASAWNASKWIDLGISPRANAYQYGLALTVGGLAQNAIGGLATPMDLFGIAADRHSQEFDGAILTRDKWDYTDEAFDADPDVDDDEVPFLADPRDWEESYKEIVSFANVEVYDKLNGIQTYWGDPTSPLVGGQSWWVNLAGGSYADFMSPATGGINFYAYEKTNATIYDQIMRITDTKVRLTILALIGNTPSNVSALLGIDVPAGAGIGEYVQDWCLGLYGMGDVVLETVRANVEYQVPTKAGYLLNLLEAGQPAYVPADDFMAKVLDDFDIDDDGLTRIPYIAYGVDLDLDGSVGAVPYGAVSQNTGQPLAMAETVYIYAYVDVSIEGGTVTYAVEYQDDQLDPEDLSIWGKGGKNENELDDWEWVFPYGDTGSQGTVTIKDGDTKFWEAGGVDQIPGFEITIILGASALAILGLIFVVMKKRKM